MSKLEADGGARSASGHTVRLKTQSLLHCCMCHQLPVYLQVLVVGKLSQAVVLAGAAYRDEATFRERTGIANTKLVCDPVFDTQVSHLFGLACPGLGHIIPNLICFYFIPFHEGFLGPFM